MGWREIEGHELQNGREVSNENCEEASKEEEIGVWRQEKTRKTMIQIYDSAGAMRCFALTC